MSEEIVPVYLHWGAVPAQLLRTPWCSSEVGLGRDIAVQMLELLKEDKEKCTAAVSMLTLGQVSKAERANENGWCMCLQACGIRGRNDGRKIHGHVHADMGRSQANLMLRFDLQQLPSCTTSCTLLVDYPIGARPCPGCNVLCGQTMTHRSCIDDS